MEFSRQEYWSGLPRPPLGDLSHPGIEPASPALQADSLPLTPPWEALSTLVRPFLHNLLKRNTGQKWKLIVAQSGQITGALLGTFSAFAKDWSPPFMGNNKLITGCKIWFKWS